MATVKVKLLRPLNGEDIGTEAEYDQADAKRLEASGAVKILSKAQGASTETKAEGASTENKSAAPAKKPS
jgi:hypothetical protein